MTAKGSGAAKSTHALTHEVSISTRWRCRARRSVMARPRTWRSLWFAIWTAPARIEAFLGGESIDADAGVNAGSTPRPPASSSTPVRGSPVLAGRGSGSVLSSVMRVPRVPIRSASYRAVRRDRRAQPSSPCRGACSPPRRSAAASPDSPPAAAPLRPGPVGRRGVGGSRRGPPRCAAAARTAQQPPATPDRHRPTGTPRPVDRSGSVPSPTPTPSPHPPTHLSDRSNGAAAPHRNPFGAKPVVALSRHTSRPSRADRKPEASTPAPGLTPRSAGLGASYAGQEEGVAQWLTTSCSWTTAVVQLVTEVVALQAARLQSPAVAREAGVVPREPGGDRRLSAPRQV